MTDGVTQADRDAAKNWSTSNDGTLLSLSVAMARHRQASIAQHEGGPGEPVAWITEESLILLRDKKAVKYSDTVPTKQRDHIIPLYAHPPSTRPAALAEDEVTSADRVVAAKCAHDGEWSVSGSEAVARYRREIITQQAEEVTRQQARADQQAEWAVREAQKAAALETEVARLRNRAESIGHVIHGIADRCDDEGDRIYLGSTNDQHTLVRQARYLIALNEQPGEEG